MALHLSRAQAGPKPEEIPDLRQKLNSLYAWAWMGLPVPPGEKPETGDQRLARLLGVKPNSISMWVNGDRLNRAPQMVPAAHLNTLCELVFGISEDVLRGDLSAFKIWLRQHAHRPPLTWRGVAAKAKAMDGFALQRHTLPPGFLYDTMGLAFDADADEEPLPVYRLGEEVRIELDLRGSPWQERASGPGIGLVLLAEDPDKIECLSPSSRPGMPDGSMRTPTVRLPLRTDRWAHVTAPTGVQALYALLSERPLAPANEIHGRLLAGGVSTATLDRLLWHFQRGSCGEWGVFRYRYRVQ